MDTEKQSPKLQWASHNIQPLPPKPKIEGKHKLRKTMTFDNKTVMELLPVA
jgi:hypothetical protein